MAGATSYRVDVGTTASAVTSTFTSANSPWVHNNLSNGQTYFYRVSAVNDAGNGPASIQVSATPIAPPPPTLTRLDVSVRAGASEPWLGENIVNDDASGQTRNNEVYAGQTQSNEIQIAGSGGSQSTTVVLSVPDWAQFAASDWSARFYDVPAGASGGGTDVTAQITSAGGWAIAMSNGEVRRLRIEVGAPAGAQAGALAALSVRAIANATSETPALDRVKTVWKAKTSQQPDLSVSALGSDDSELWLGEDVLNLTGEGQTLMPIIKATITDAYAVNLKNAGAHAAAFTLSVPASSNGWKVALQDALEAGQIVTPDAKGNWTSPVIEAGATLTLRLEITAPAGSDLEANAAARNGKFELRATNGSLSDVVAVSAASQSVAKILWSRDGQNWNDPAQTPLTVEQYEVVAFRAVGSNPAVAWDDMPGFEPTWSSQGETHWGETVWIHFPQIGVVPISAECGVSKSVSVEVNDAP